MILNRISTLWLNAAVAIVNVLALTAALMGVVIPGAYIAAIDFAAASIISLIANAQMAFPVSEKLAAVVQKVVH